MSLPYHSINRYNALMSAMFLGCTLLISPAVSSAEVYRTINSDGQVLYTDDIHKAAQNNQHPAVIQVIKVDNTVSPQISASQIVGEPQAARETRPSQPASLTSDSQHTLSTQPIKPSSKGDYVLQIISPQPQQAVRRGSQAIEISTTLQPALKTGDRVIYKLNNKTLATTTALKYSISTAGLDPKPYTITVGVENIVGEIIVQESRVLYVLSNNSVYQQKRKAVAAEAKRNAERPWYHKIHLF